MSNKVYDNEKWWQENGLEWVKEIEKRRKSQPLYGIQEVILSEYFSTIPNGSKVLEFGAGFGRHAKYLSELSNMEYFALDQSPTMKEAYRAYTEDKLPMDNFTLIEPRERLPFPDNYFDVVFTVSVLIHINPEHIKQIIDELKRVAKHVIIHFENKLVDVSQLQFVDHNGCWRHAVQNLYEKVEIINDISEEQTLYIVHMSEDNNYDFKINPTVRKRLYIMDDNLGLGLREAQGEIGWRQKQLEKDEQQISELQGEVGWRQKQLEKDEQQILDLKVEVEQQKNTIEESIKQKNIIEENIKQNLKEKQILQSQLDAVNNELNTIYSSNAWRIAEKLKSNSLIRWSAKKAISGYKVLKGNKKIVQPVNGDSAQVERSSICEEFKMELANSNEIVVITHKNWLGVKNATKELFNDCIELEEITGHSQVVEIGDAIINKKVKSLIFSGFASGWNSLCTYIKKNAPEIRTVVFWHGSTTHMYEDYSWARYQEILQLCKDKQLDKIAFAKESMCEIYKDLGVDVGFIQNYVNNTNKVIDASNNKEVDYNNLRIGIYSSGGTWNKNAYTQIAAASLFKNATISMVPYNERMYTFASQLGLKVCGSQTNMKREELVEELKKNDINFYVTFSECAPLIPLESLNCGTICLTGNNHHYFKGTELEKYLIVDRPDDAIAIYKQAINALEHKSEILELYSEWYKDNKIKAQESVRDL